LEQHVKYPRIIIDLSSLPDDEKLPPEDNEKSPPENKEK
jgi:hypothetical protein